MPHPHPPHAEATATPASPSSSALDHARRLAAAGDSRAAAAAVLDGWLELLVDGFAADTDAFLAVLPDEEGDAPDVLAVRACCARIRGDSEGARLLIARSRARRGHADESPLYALFLEDAEDLVSEAIEETVSVIEQGRLRGRSHAYAVYLAGWTLLRSRRDPVRARALLESARADATARGFDVLAGRAASNLAFASAFGGDLIAAAESLRTAPPQPNGPWRLYDGGIEGVTEGFIHYWHGDLTRADAAFRRVIEEEPRAPYAHLARIFCALVAAERSHDAGFEFSVAELRRVPQETQLGVPWPSWRAVAECALARSRGDRAFAARAARRVLAADNVPIATAIAADVLRWAGDIDGARTALGRISRRHPPSYLVTSIGVTRALIAVRAGDVKTAHFRLEQALEAAGEQGTFLPLLREDPTLRALLAGHRAWGSRQDAVLAQIADSGLERSGTHAALSEREQQVLRLLRTRMTAGEIADSLGVSINTLKTHQRNLYRKLDVATRRDAVARTS